MVAAAIGDTISVAAHRPAMLSALRIETSIKGNLTGN